MRILHLITSDNNGGASRAAFRLHKGLLKCGVNSEMFVLNKSTNYDSVIKYRFPSGIGKVLYRINKTLIANDFKRYASTRPSDLEVFSDDRSALKTGFLKQLPDADIYNLHWISGFVDISDFFSGIKKPVVWTMHDMFPFTGGCHYSNGCEKYLNMCNQCPQLGSTSIRDLSYDIWRRKSKTLSSFNNKLSIRADSYWLASEAKRSSLFRNLDIDTAHYGIETDQFFSRDKLSCRRALNIPEKSKVIVFGAPAIDNPRKGFKELYKSLKILNQTFPDLFLLSFGGGNISPEFNITGSNMGHVSDNNLLAVIYTCGDVFVIPSLQEAFGQTALEAMSCGIPVAGFNTGGIPDMIEDGITGYMAENGNVEDLADAIKCILTLSETEYQRMALNCREKVMNGFTIAHQAEKYLKVYRKLLNS